MVTAINPAGERKYEYAEFARAPVSAQILGEELDRIKQANGGILKQEDVVSSARVRSSPIHSCFEWDEKKAAHSYRLQQAGYLIRAILVVAVDRRPVPHVRVYSSGSSGVGARGTRGVGYVDTLYAMQKKTSREKLLEDALNDLKELQIKYAKLTELAGVFAAVKRALKRNKKTRQPLKRV